MNVISEAFNTKRMQAVYSEFAKDNRALTKTETSFSPHQKDSSFRLNFHPGEKDELNS
jgi:hypothetical protein